MVLLMVVWGLAAVVALLILGEHPSVPSRPSCTAVVRCARTICVPRHLTSAVSIGPTVWISTFAQRCIEHGELVDSCAERLEASQPKTGEPCPVPVGTVATYGPGLAPLEYARLTGLMNRYAVTESGGASDAERTSEGQIEHGALSDVHAPWQGNGAPLDSKQQQTMPKRRQLQRRSPQVCRHEHWRRHPRGHQRRRRRHLEG
jgi:hypothetical protein